MMRRYDGEGKSRNSEHSSNHLQYLTSSKKDTINTISIYSLILTSFASQVCLSKDVLLKVPGLTLVAGTSATPGAPGGFRQYEKHENLPVCVTDLVYRY